MNTATITWRSIIAAIALVGTFVFGYHPFAFMLTATSLVMACMKIEKSKVYTNMIIWSFIWSLVFSHWSVFWLTLLSTVSIKKKKLESEMRFGG